MTATPNLFTRPDTLFGVCEGLGEETGLPAFLFRIAFAVPLIFAPGIVLGIYLALGLALLAMRTIAPLRRAPIATAEVAILPVPAAAREETSLALAA